MLPKKSDQTEITKTEITQKLSVLVMIFKNWYKVFYFDFNMDKHDIPMELLK